MSFVSLLNPLGLLALIGLPVIILLYMRTTTPTRRTLPSIRFWMALQSTPVETRRFRLPPFSLLLLLHLLVVAAIAFALARPSTSRVLAGFGTNTDPVHLVLVLDGSTSMQASADELGVAGRTRFDLAIDAAQDRIGSLGGGDALTVLLVGTHTTTFVASDEIGIGDVSDRLEGLRAPGGRADLNAALRLCRDLLLPGMDDRIVVISDGAIALDPALVAEIEAPVEVEVIAGEGSSANVAITEIVARGSSAEPGRQELTVRIANFADAPQSGSLRITADDVEVEVESVTIAPNTIIAFRELLPAGASTATAELELADALPADNTASIVLAHSGASGIRILLVSDTGVDLLRALSSLPGAQVTALTTGQFLAAGVTEAVDLVVVDGAVPQDALPDLPVLVVNPTSGQPGDGGTMPLPEPSRIRAQDPILNGVDLAGVSFGQAPILTLDASDVEVVGAAEGPLIYRTRTPQDRPAIVLAFDINASNLPVRVAFPILISNLVSDLVARTAPAQVALGESLTLEPRAGTALVRLTNPVGAETEIAVVPVDPAAPDAGNQAVTFGETGLAGRYRLTELDGAGLFVSETSLFINAGHPEESDLRPNPFLQNLLSDVVQSEEVSSIRQRSDLWPILIALAIGVLIVEWIVTTLQGRPVRPRPARVAR